MRMSLLEALLLDVAIAVVWSLVLVVFPVLIIITPSFTSLTVLTVALGFAFSLSTGWAIGCVPAMPAVFWSKQIIEMLVFQLLPLCPWLGPGLINEDTYTNDRCTVCANWQSGMWTVPGVQVRPSSVLRAPSDPPGRRNSV
jgi:hypothetical protein